MLQKGVDGWTGNRHNRLTPTKQPEDMNFNRMTIRVTQGSAEVFKLSRNQNGGYYTDMAQAKFVWFVPKHAKPRFVGSYTECLTYISQSGAEFMTEHGIPC